MPLPPEFSITSGIFADVNQDGKPENIFVRGNILYIYSGKKMLFKSPGMGGSIAYVTYDINPDQQAPQSQTVSLEIAPLAADIDNDGHPEIIAVASNNSSVSIPSIYSGFKSSILAVFKYEKGSFVRGTIKVMNLNLPWFQGGRALTKKGLAFLLETTHFGQSLAGQRRKASRLKAISPMGGKKSFFWKAPFFQKSPGNSS